MATNLRHLRRPLVPHAGTEAGGGKKSRNRPSPVSPENLEAIRKDIMSKRLRLNRMQVADDEQSGLRALIYPTGLITLSAHYAVFDEDRRTPTGRFERPYIKVAHYPMGISAKEGQKIIDLARKRTAIIQEIGRRGIDVQAGLHERLLKELDAQGIDWKP